jgi:hypothetical protein
MKELWQEQVNLLTCERASAAREVNARNELWLLSQAGRGVAVIGLRVRNPKGY